MTSSENDHKPVHYTYILKCSDGTLYTGYTNNIEKRLKAHNAGKGAKYTRSRTPVTLVYFETFEDKSGALRREIEIKKMRREEKELLTLMKKIAFQSNK